MGNEKAYDLAEILKLLQQLLLEDLGLAPKYDEILHFHVFVRCWV